ncbi:hypothetical protein [Telluria beijingensis]|uniref:hypothetical protein n=1 Tax=Telluria beijingensis TaxID=3068633 RepID=UPI002795FB9D|nr:hypothetical protein [Massilia sp. REN29]
MQSATVPICVRLVATLALVTAASLPANAAQPMSTNDDILGTWRITKMLDASNVAALDHREASRLVGKLFIVAPEKVSLNGESCTEPEFARHYEDTVRYLREEAHASSWKLGLPLTVTVIDLSCTEALIKGHDRIVVLWKGVFFDAVKQVSEAPGQARR